MFASMVDFKANYYPWYKRFLILESHSRAKGLYDHTFLYGYELSSFFSPQTLIIVNNGDEITTHNVL